MHLQVITPNKTIFNLDIEELTINTADGEISVLPDHAKLITKVIPGEMTVKLQGKLQYFAVTGGFMEVSENKITILADYAVASEEISVEKALDAKKRAEEVIKKKKEGISEKDFASAQSDLRRAIAEIQVANRRRRERAPMPQG